MKNFDLFMLLISTAGVFFALAWSISLYRAGHWMPFAVSIAVLCFLVLQVMKWLDITRG